MVVVAAAADGNDGVGGVGDVTCLSERRFEVESQARVRARGRIPSEHSVVSRTPESVSPVADSMIAEPAYIARWVLRLIRVFGGRSVPRWPLPKRVGSRIHEDGSGVGAW